MKYLLVTLWCVLISSAYAQQEFDIRLSDGNTPREGRVEIFYEGIWGTVCDQTWNLADAEVVCKQLNLSYAISSPRSVAFGEGQGHTHAWLLDCLGDEESIGDCVRLGRSGACGHDQDASVICSDRGKPGAYDVRIVGGSHSSTGQVELYLNKKWSVMCSTPWTIIEADTVCRQAGYGGALINEGVIPFPVSRPSSLYPTYTGLLDCSKGRSDVRGYGHMFGCKNNLVTAQRDFTCEWPNTVACTRHQAALPARLYGGHSNSTGRVEVSYGRGWFGICPEQWDLTDANVICHQLGYGAALEISATVSYPDGQDTRFYLMSKVNCSGEETNIGACERVYGTRRCAGGDYAMVTCDEDICSQPKATGLCKAYFPSYFYNTDTGLCEEFIYGGCGGNENRFESERDCKKQCGRKGRAFNKTVITIALCLLLIPALLLILFLVVYCVFKKRRREEEHSDERPKESKYSPVVDEKECIELNHGDAQTEPNEPMKVRPFCL